LNTQEKIKHIAGNRLGEAELFSLSVEALKDEEITEKEQYFFSEIRNTTRFAVMLGSSVGMNYSLLQQDAKSLLTS